MGTYLTECKCMHNFDKELLKIALQTYINEQRALNARLMDNEVSIETGKQHRALVLAPAEAVLRDLRDIKVC